MRCATIILYYPHTPVASHVFLLVSLFVNILAISGSLRSGASSTSVLEAAGMVAPAGIRVRLYQGLDGLPHFNPDLDTPDGVGLPPRVRELRNLVGESNGLLLSSPEYAHGIPGSFKNLLDWLVASVELPGKPVAILNTSTMSVHAPAQLLEILTTMNARIVHAASFSLVLPRRSMTPADIAVHPALKQKLVAALVALTRAAEDSLTREAPESALSDD